MALAVVMAGQAVEVTEPRVCRMIQFLLAREKEIRDHKQGHVEFHYGAPGQKVRARLWDEICLTS